VLVRLQAGLGFSFASRAEILERYCKHATWLWRVVLGIIRHVQAVWTFISPTCAGNICKIEMHDPLVPGLVVLQPTQPCSLVDKCVQEMPQTGCVVHSWKAGRGVWNAGRPKLGVASACEAAEHAQAFTMHTSEHDCTMACGVLDTVRTPSIGFLPQTFPPSKCRVPATIGCEIAVGAAHASWSSEMPQASCAHQSARRTLRLRRAK
jgi:hypothetical protein